MGTVWWKRSSLIVSVAAAGCLSAPPVEGPTGAAGKADGEEETEEQEDPVLEGDCLFGLVYQDFLRNPNLSDIEGTTYSSYEELRGADGSVPEEAAIVAAFNHGSDEASTIEEIFDAVDEGAINVTWASIDSEEYFIAVEYGAGGNSYGAIVAVDDNTVVAGIGDGDLYDCKRFEHEDAWAMMTAELVELQPELEVIGEPQAFTVRLGGERSPKWASVSAFARDDLLRVIREEAEYSYDGYEVTSLPTEDDLAQGDFSPNERWYVERVLGESWIMNQMQDPPSAEERAAVLAAIDAWGGDASVDTYLLEHEVDSERYGEPGAYARIWSLTIMIHSRETQEVSVIRFPLDWNAE